MFAGLPSIASVKAALSEDASQSAHATPAKSDATMGSPQLAVKSAQAALATSNKPASLLRKSTRELTPLVNAPSPTASPTASPFHSSLAAPSAILNLSPTRSPVSRIGFNPNTVAGAFAFIAKEDALEKKRQEKQEKKELEQKIKQEKEKLVQKLKQAKEELVQKLKQTKEESVQELKPAKEELEQKLKQAKEESEQKRKPTKEELLMRAKKELLMQAKEYAEHTAKLAAAAKESAKKAKNEATAKETPINVIFAYLKQGEAEVQESLADAAKENVKELEESLKKESEAVLHLATNKM